MLLVELNKMLKRIPLVDLNYNLTNIFPVSVHGYNISKFDEIQQQLIDYVYDLEKKDPIGVEKSNRGGWQSHTFQVNDKDNLLHDILIKSIFSLPTKRDESLAFDVWAWVNINRSGDYNARHVHPNSHLAGVFWIKTPPNSGNIEFTSSYEFVGFEELEKLYPDEFVEKYNSYRIYYFPPVAGDILIFPSHLQHEVKENKSDEDRISVSFNISIKHV